VAKTKLTELLPAATLADYMKDPAFAAAFEEERRLLELTESVSD